VPAKTLTVQQRKSIFHALVEVQDSRTHSVPESKKEIATRFHITKEQVELIEREGLAKDWPPLA
jgi:NADH:ubiquinone oxidoreductase subunit E